MLAHSSPDIKERALAAPLTVYTSGTPATPARLRSLLVDVRLRGFAYCPGFVHEEALGIAAPVRAGKGEVIAALSVIVPNEAAGRAVVPVVRTAARGLSRVLGG
ncbi:IclR family transcriptional regulator C-terminal domain-containing protein [Streptomyces sp. MMS24-I2-30]|uniref:IclR family transcriptional regulator domain-containing protein n=1 Tax=Streptomyces sp. MMS24-I2-30 TaxID=3351564 RepID=UPI003896956D